MAEGEDEEPLAAYTIGLERNYKRYSYVYQAVCLGRHVPVHSKFRLSRPLSSNLKADESTCAQEM